MDYKLLPIQNIWQPRRTTFPFRQQWKMPNKCNRCGEGFEYMHYCKATQRRCYKCRDYGHYADFCRSARMYAVLKETNSTISISKDNIKLSSNHDTLSEMPYFTLTNEDLLTMGPKNTCLDVTNDEEILDLAITNTKLEWDIKDLTEKCAAITEELNTGLDREEQMESKLSDLWRRYADQSKLICEALTCCKFYESILSIKTERETKIIEEFQTMMSGSSEKLSEPDDSNRHIGRKCNKCGSFRYHHPSKCPARTNKCYHCDICGHFTGFCKSPKSDSMLDSSGEDVRNWITRQSKFVNVFVNSSMI